MAFRASGIPQLNLGTVKAAPRPRQSQRRGGGQRVVVPAVMEDRNYEQQVDEREHKQALEIASQGRIRPQQPQQQRPKREAMASAPPAYVSGEQEWSQMGGKTLAQIATEDPGPTANRNQSLIDFAGGLMDQVPDGSGRVMLSKSMVAQLPGFVEGMSGLREPRPVYVQREKGESGAELLSFYEQGEDGAAVPLLNNGAPVRLSADMMANAANISRLGRERVAQVEDRDYNARAAMDLEKAKQSNKPAKWEKMKRKMGADDMGNPIEQEVMFDPETGRTMSPWADTVKGMSDKDAGAVADDMADGIAGWFSGDGDDFRQWGGRAAFVAGIKQELQSGIYDKRRQDLLTAPSEVIKQLAERGGTQVEIQNIFKKYGVGMPKVSKKQSKAAMPAADAVADSGGGLFGKPKSREEALGPRAVKATIEAADKSRSMDLAKAANAKREIRKAVTPAVDAVKGMKARSEENVLRTRLPVIKAAIRRGNMTKAELAEAMKVIDLLPEKMREKVKVLAGSDRG